MDDILLRAGGWLLIALFALLMSANAIDHGFAAQMVIVAGAAFLVAVWTMRGAGNAALASGGSLPPPRDRYDDEVIRWGVIATVFWCVIGLLVGVVIASQLTFPLLNFHSEYTTFGRLRPLHTSAVIFAFGGNALICTSYYVVQRTCRTRLAFPWLARFVFWGYQLFIVLAASGYLLGITEGREYAEPEWYVDIWLTIVWVSYLAVFVGTIVRRSEPHIYVANWFYLGFIIT
ncbi:MAG: cbb3-type cytochrome c oxidase subunit I, partial [Sphingomonas bacterium]